MRTTIDIHAPLLEKAKRLAAERGVGLADVVNDALSEALGRGGQPEGEAPPYRLVTYRGTGPATGVDLHDNAAVRDAMDEGPRA